MIFELLDNRKKTSITKKKEEETDVIKFENLIFIEYDKQIRVKASLIGFEKTFIIMGGNNEKQLRESFFLSNVHEARRIFRKMLINKYPNQYDLKRGCTVTIKRL